jgi:hypothetical protein
MRRSVAQDTIHDEEMVKIEVMLEKGVRVLRRRTAKSAMFFGPRAVSCQAIDSEGQDVAVLVDGAQIPERWATDLAMCSEPGSVVCSEWEPVICFDVVCSELELVLYHMVAKDYGCEIVTMADRQPTYSVIPDASGPESGHEDYTSHH